MHERRPITTGSSVAQSPAELRGAERLTLEQLAGGFRDRDERATVAREQVLARQRRPARVG